MLVLKSFIPYFQSSGIELLTPSFIHLFSCFAKIMSKEEPTLRKPVGHDLTNAGIR